MTAEGRAWLRNPKNATKKAQAFREATYQGSRGVTAKEISRTLGVHHGSASGSLSILHRDGYLDRLVEKRFGFSIYVIPHQRNGRDSIPSEKQKGDNSGHVKAAGLRDVIKDCIDLSFDPRLSEAEIVDKMIAKMNKALKDFA